MPPVSLSLGELLRGKQFVLGDRREVDQALEKSRFLDRSPGDAHLAVGVAHQENPFGIQRKCCQGFPDNVHDQFAPPACPSCRSQRSERSRAFWFCRDSTQKAGLRVASQPGAGK